MIRKAQAGEAEAVRGVVLSAYERYVAVIGRAPGPMLDDHALRIAADQVWVLEEADGIAGVLVLEDGPAGFLLDNIAVRPDRQGRGLADRYWISRKRRPPGAAVTRSVCIPTR